VRKGEKVSFAKEPYERDDILQKRPMILNTFFVTLSLYRPNAAITYRVTRKFIVLFCRISSLL